MIAREGLANLHLDVLPSNHPMIGIYLRISDDPLGMRAGVERQSTDCHVLAGARWRGEQIRVYEDNDRSAYRGTRPAFNELLADIQSHTITAVIGYDLDRMFRQPRELEAFIDLCELHRLTRILTARGDLDLTSHDGQLHARILVAVARKSSDDNSRRVKRAALDRAEQGRWHGGPIPYGYVLSQGTLQVDELAARHVLVAARMVARGASIASIVRMGHGPTTHTGWRCLLQTPTVAGYTRLHAEADWPAIIPRDLWLEIQQIITGRKHAQIPRQHWLTGLLICGICQSRCVVHSPGKYMCEGASCAAIKSEWAEDCVSGQMFAYVKVNLPPEPQLLKTLQTDSKVPDGKLTELAVDYADGRITREEWLAVRERLIQTGQQPAPVSPAVVPTDLDELWPELTPAEQHHMASRLLVKVLLLPAAHARVAPADRLFAEWRM